ncbi:MAG TPA: archease [Gaiellaceae bacterium]|nr:archease [Gaiellaceae bacterium]
MSHRYVEHVGEVELALEAPSQAGVFSEATAAFRELVDGTARTRPEPLTREVSLGPAGPARLLADWLDELVFLAEVDAFVPERVVAIELDGRRLRATLEGVRGMPRHLVKAATLHGLELSRDGEVWRARVVLDV